jgi:Na+-translocating ferredoxin:NAD+ oxidoreductase RnfD subunit
VTDGRSRPRPSGRYAARAGLVIGAATMMGVAVIGLTIASDADGGAIDVIGLVLFGIGVGVAAWLVRRILDSGTTRR